MCDLISYFTQKLVTDAQVSCNLEVRKASGELWVSFYKLGIALIGSFTQIIDHSSL